MGDWTGMGRRVSIGREMADDRAMHEHIVHPERDGAVRAPEPPNRPSAHAQWDEVQACWVEWHEAEGAWRPVDPAPEEADPQPEV